MIKNKELTPMSRFSELIKEFKGLIINEFEFVLLNKSAPKSSYRWNVADKKGVESDCLLIFKAKKQDVSFAFQFNYLGLKPDEHSIVISIKNGNTNEDIVCSKTMNLNEFKIGLKKVILQIKLIQKDKAIKVLSEINNIFLDGIDVAKEIEERESILISMKIEKENEIGLKEDKIKIHQLENKYGIAKENYWKELKASKEYNEVEELSKKIEMAKRKLEIKKKELDDKYSVTYQSKEIDKVGAQIMFKEDLIKKEMEEISKKSITKLRK